jgi:hypothetical protein
MAIYDRFGFAVKILRLAQPQDFRKLEGRKPDKKDAEAMKLEAVVIVTDVASPNGKPMPGPEPEVLIHIAFLRADGGLGEIQDAIEALKASK